MSEYISGKLQNITLNRGLEIYGNNLIEEPDENNIKEDLSHIIEEVPDSEEVLEVLEVPDPEVVLEPKLKKNINTLSNHSSEQLNETNDVFKYLFIVSLLVIGVLIYNRNIR